MQTGTSEASYLSPPLPNSQRHRTATTTDPLYRTRR